MAATAEDTQREIGRLRGDMGAALDEIQRRLRGGLRTVATTEARVTSTRAREDALARSRENPALAGVVGVVVLGAVGFLVFRAVVAPARERNKPQQRLKRRVERARTDLVSRVSESVERGRHELEQRQRGLLLKLDPQDGGYVRITDARLEPLADKSKERTDVIKKLVWAGLLSVFMAAGSVLARRVAGSVWRVTVREEPPTKKAKTD